MTIDMLYSTYKDRIYMLKNNLPQKIVGVKIIIIHQVDELDNYEIDFLLNRDDILYVPSFTTGVARSRNIAINCASSDIIMFCDDDVIYEPEAIKEVISLYKSNSNYKAVTFAYKKGNRGYGRFSLTPYTHSLLSILSVGTIEVSCLLTAVKNANAKFPENLGAGEKYFLCDEPVFLSKLVKKYSNEIVYKPLIIGSHPEIASGVVFNDKNAYKSRLLCFQYIYGGFSGLLLYYFFLIKNLKKIKSSYFYFAFFNVIFYK